MPNRFARRAGRSQPSIGRQRMQQRQARKDIAKAVEANGHAVLSSQEKLQQEVAEEDNKDLKTYKSHGVHFHESKDGESRALCPFCHENGFSVNEGKGLGEDGKPSTKGGMFKCWACGKSGNKYTFLQLYYDQCYDQTSAAHLKTLAGLRNLPVEAFKMAEWAYDKTLKRWLIPTRNRKGSMVNLPYWVPDTNIVYNTGGCAAHLYNLERLDDSHTVFVCEGQHDVVALEYLLYQAKAKDYSVVGVPGADTFKPEWSEHFADKKVFLAYDNDERGEQGQKKAADILRKHTRCRELHSISWPESYPTKFDVRDFTIKSAGKYPKSYFEFLQMFEPLVLHDEKSCGVVREKFVDVVKDFKQHIHFSEDMENGLALAFAVVLSNVILEDPYCPIWTFLVGPPGSGKTLIIETVSDNDLVVPLDKMTANSLVSMYKMPDGSDPSLLPKVIGKTLAMKDWTVVMRLPSGDQEVIHGTMRAAFDGRFGGASGVGNGRTYPEPGSGHETCHFTFISGVTDDIYLQNRTAVGERTLKFKIFRGSSGILDHIRSAAKNTLEGTVPELILREFANAFIEHKRITHNKTPAMPKDIEDRLTAASQISCITSAIVHRKQGELLRRPSPTVATRMMKQLIHVAQSLAFVFDLDEVDERCYGICKQMALDTCDGWHADILLALSEFPKGALRDDIMLKTKEMDRPVKSTTIQRCLEDLFELAAVTYETVGKDDESGTGRRGQPARKWFLTPTMQELFSIAKINEKPKSVKKVQALPANRRSAKKKATKKRAAVKKAAPRKPAAKIVKKKARRR